MAQSIGARDDADRQDGHRLIVAAARTCAVHRRGAAARSEKFCVRAPSGRKFSSLWSHSRRLLRAATPTKSIELSRMAGCSRPGSRRNRSNSQIHRKKFGFQRFSENEHPSIVFSTPKNPESDLKILAYMYTEARKGVGFVGKRFADSANS